MSLVRRAPSAAARLVVVPVLAALVLTACSGGGDEPAASPSTPAGVDLPAGVRLTEAGSTVKVGDPVTVLVPVGRTASAVRVRVESIRKGDIDDFRFFSLDESLRRSTPYYVRLQVRNEGPAGLGGVSPPVLVRSSEDVLFPANDVVGSFRPCPNGSLPESFLPEATADLCLVYLLPRGQSLASVDVQPAREQDAVRVEP